MRESGGQHRGFALDSSNLGDITVSRLALADGADLLAGATISDTLMHVRLPQVLPPGGHVELQAAWVSKLPRVFARTGYGGRDDTFFMVGQWYPKLAVYDRGRWDAEPWHANAEFFHDFGSYDVRITVPSAYVVAGAGVLAGEQQGGDGTKTLHYTAAGVTDFAFAASPDFLTRDARAGAVDVALFYMPEHAGQVQEYLDTAVGSLQAYSGWYGAYPHPRLTVVDVPDSASGAGGMEYPTLVTGGSLGVAVPGVVGMIAAHEIAHQWWPMQTATHEGREPWLDEGLTEYSGIRYLASTGRRIGYGAFGISARGQERLQYGSAPDLPATLPSWEYSQGAYGAAVYGKTAVGVWTLENVVGSQRLRQAMAEYLARFRYKHPTAADFRTTIELSLGSDLRWFFDDYLATGSAIEYAVDPIAQTDTGDTVTIRRVGQVPAPVDIRIVLASGATQDRQWDGSRESISYTFPSDDPVVQVVVDPEYKLVAELNRLDNGASARVEVGPAVTLGGRLAFVFQALAQLLTMFG
ncbi:MAG TPA: M1 family metallopeptidase [Roseiflexaceae bacterium]|nr:M1 family metallopeptidase [Roseiflexaceae bacterium]